MADTMPPKDRQFFRMLPLLVGYIKTNKKLTDEEIMGFIKMFPDHSSFVQYGQYDRMVEMAKKYKDDPTFGPGIKVVLSQEGQRWLNDFFSQLDRLRKKMYR